MPRRIFALLFALTACSPEPEGTPAPDADADAPAPEYQRFQGRYQGTDSRDWSGLAGFCQHGSERFLILAGVDAGLVYFILPEHRDWRGGEYAVNDPTYAGPDLSDPDLIHAVLMGVDPREQGTDTLLVDTDATSGTLRVDRVTPTHLTGTMRLNVRVEVVDLLDPRPPERATITAAFNAYPMGRCPEVIAGG